MCGYCSCRSCKIAVAKISTGRWEWLPCSEIARTPEDLGGVSCLEWMKTKLWSFTKFVVTENIKLKSAKHRFFIVCKRLSPQFLLSWEETCTCCRVWNYFHGSSCHLWAGERQHRAVGRAVAGWQSRFVRRRALGDVPVAREWLWGVFLLLSAKEQVAFKDTNVPLETILIRARLWIPWLLWLRPVTAWLGPGPGGNVF